MKVCCEVCEFWVRTGGKVGQCQKQEPIQVPVCGNWHLMIPRTVAYFYCVSFHCKDKEQIANA